MLTCRLCAMFGSSPSVTNSPVPIPKPPSANASSARLTGPIVRRGRAIIEVSLVIGAQPLVGAVVAARAAAGVSRSAVRGNQRVGPARPAILRDDGSWGGEIRGCAVRVADLCLGWPAGRTG